MTRVSLDNLETLKMSLFSDLFHGFHANFVITSLSLKKKSSYFFCADITVIRVTVRVVIYTANDANMALAF